MYFRWIFMFAQHLSSSIALSPNEGNFFSNLRFHNSNWNLFLVGFFSQFAIQSKVIYQRFFWIKILRKNKNYHHWFRTLFGNHILTVCSVIRSQKSRYRGRRIGVKMISIGLLWHSPPFSSFRWVLEEEQWWNRSYLLDFEGNLYVIRFSFGVAGFFYEN